MSLLRNRVEAGKQLAKALKTADENAIVLAVPRGGVVVGYEVARALDVPLDVIVTKKIGAPDNPELAIGAVAEDGTFILDEDLARRLLVSKEYINEEVERIKQEIQRRLIRYRGNVPYPSFKNREVIVVDDGVATGSTLKAALRLLRHKGAKTVTVAIPVGPPDTIRELEKLADRVVCLLTPEPFYAIGQFYMDFTQTSDEEVTELLKLSRGSLAKEAKKLRKEDAEEEEVTIPVGKEVVYGNLTVPQGAKSIVLFAHGSGSSRFSRRNTQVAREINTAGIATLLIDLLTKEEEAIDEFTGEFRFNIDLLAQRLVHATEWTNKNIGTKSLAIGYFGASTGAAAALIAAAKLPDHVKAVVSRGGRPDLAGEHLPNVKAPTLLIVGGDDTEVLELNRQASDQMTAERKTVVVPGATHLFEEPGKMEEVSRLAIGWFSKHLG